MSDPISPYRRGGYSSDYNTYSTWINNGTGKLFDTAADGSWLDNGDYERAYKGFPSYKQVNLFFGGGVYSAPSWKTTLGFGIGKFLTTGLGLWLLGSLGRKKQPAQAQASVTVNPYLTYFNNLKARFMPTGLSGTTGGTGTNKTCDCDCCNGKKKTDDTDGTQAPKDKDKVKDNDNVDNTRKVDNDDAGDKDKVFEATATNIKSIYNVSGAVKNQGKLNADGYPESFEIHDHNITKDKDHPNIYKYVYVRKDEATGKPVYKFDSATLYTNVDKDNITVNKNEFLVNNGIVKDKGITGNITDMKAINPTGPGVSKDALSAYADGMESVTIP